MVKNSDQATEPPAKARKSQKTGPDVPSVHDEAFLSRTRHEIRGAMHVIIGMAKILSMSTTLTPSQKEVIAMLRKNADRTMELTDGLFAWLQATHGETDTGVPGPARKPPPIPKGKVADFHRRDSLMLPSTIGFLSLSSTPRALLVEDSAASAMITTYFLKMLKYVCDVAKNSTEALEKFSKNTYDVVIMDIQLPGEDGVETTKLMREIERVKKSAPTPILAVTGNATVDDKLICLKAGMDDYLTKPFELYDLEKKLKSVFEKNPGKHNKGN